MQFKSIQKKQENSFFFYFNSINLHLPLPHQCFWTSIMQIAIAGTAVSHLANFPRFDFNLCFYLFVYCSPLTAWIVVFMSTMSHRIMHSPFEFIFRYKGVWTFCFTNKCIECVLYFYFADTLGFLIITGDRPMSLLFIALFFSLRFGFGSSTLNAKTTKNRTNWICPKQIQSIYLCMCECTCEWLCSKPQLINKNF